MPAETVTLQIPEIIYHRLVNTARAMNRPLEKVILRALQIGSPQLGMTYRQSFKQKLQHWINWMTTVCGK